MNKNELPIEDLLLVKFKDYSIETDRDRSGGLGGDRDRDDHRVCIANLCHCGKMPKINHIVLVTFLVSKTKYPIPAN